MKKYFQLSALSYALLFANTAFAITVPTGIWSIDNVTIGKTTFSEIQKLYGPSTVYKIGKEEEADENICYVYSKAKNSVFLIFESGVMGGNERDITGFELSFHNVHRDCTPTAIDITNLSTRNGVRLNQNISDFKNLLPLKFKKSGSELIYTGLEKRYMTEEELKKTRAAWPDAATTYFDVTITIKANFINNRLSDFYVHKIESY
jgi:hypothetical protein